MATLRALPKGQSIEFSRLRTIVGTTDGNLGAHLSTLEKADYIVVTKEFTEKKPRSLIAMTNVGKRAFDAHVAYLRDILDGRQLT
ncbi:hypothetical protein R8510_05138 [Ralstonia chuxiongensis]|nr:hypothetical protein R8510_05138 [Ralstonia chuxiongensis]